MIGGVSAPAILAAAQQAQAAIDGRGPKLAPETAIQAQAAEKEQDGPGDDVARRIFEADAKDPEPKAETEKGADGLTPAEERQVRSLQQQDAAIRRHEQAHAAAGGAYAGAPQYQYTTGPDGRRYAVGGEVSIDAGAVRGNPEATIAKLQTVKRAALAPTDPSPQDRRVAAQADLGIAQARVELRDERADPAAGDKGRGAENARAADAPGPASAKRETPPAVAETGPRGAAAGRPPFGAVPPGANLDLVV